MTIPADDLIGQQVNQIMKSTDNNLGLDYNVTLHTTIGDYVVTLLESIETNSDYNNSFVDYKLVNFVVPGGTYRDYVKNSKNDLEISIDKYKNKELLFTETYKAILVNTSTDVDEDKIKLSSSDLNKVSMVRVTLMLVHREVEVLRGYMVDGVYTNVTIKNILQTILNSAKNIKIQGKAIELNVNIDEPHNPNVYGHIIIPTGTGYLDLPTFLQDTKYGVYNGDIGLYFKKTTKDGERKLGLYLYPLYTLPLTPKKELCIYHTANPYLDFIENTYEVVGDVLRVASTTELTSLDSNDNLEIDQGNALTHSDPYKSTSYNAVTGNDKITYSSKQQVSSMKPSERADGMNIETYVGNEPNLYKHRSKIMKNTFNHIQVRWNHSNPSLLLPGMSVKLFYQKGDVVLTMEGILQRAFTVYYETTKTNSTLLNLMVRKSEDAED